MTSHESKHLHQRTLSGRNGPQESHWHFASFLFQFDSAKFLTENGRNLVLHKSPWNVRTRQKTLLSTWTVDLGSDSLTLYALLWTGKTELVFHDWWTLNKVNILQLFFAQGTSQRLRTGGLNRRIRWPAGWVSAAPWSRVLIATWWNCIWTWYRVT